MTQTQFQKLAQLLTQFKNATQPPNLMLRWEN